MAMFYVPARIKGVNAYAGNMPQSNPTASLYHFDREKEAEAYLNGQTYQDPYYGDQQKGGTEPMTYGPQNDIVMWPKMETVYCVEVEMQRRLEALELSKPTKDGKPVVNLPGIANYSVGRMSIDPSSITHRKTTIGVDALHREPRVIYEDVPLGGRLSDEQIQKLYQGRCEELDRLHKILERSGLQERAMLDMSNPEHADTMQRVCLRDREGKDLAEQTLLRVQRQIGEQCGVRTVLSTSAIEAEFAAQLNAQDPNTPAAERVAIAMSGTLQKFAATIPTRDAPAVGAIAGKVRGIVHEAEAEMDAHADSVHEVGHDDFVKNILKRVPEEDREKFQAEFERQREAYAARTRENDELALATTVFAMRTMAEQAGIPAKIAFYESLEKAVENLGFEEREEAGAFDGPPPYEERDFGDEPTYY